MGDPLTSPAGVLPVGAGRESRAGSRVVSAAAQRPGRGATSPSGHSSYKNALLSDTPKAARKQYAQQQQQQQQQQQSDSGYSGSSKVTDVDGGTTCRSASAQQQQQQQPPPHQTSQPQPPPQQPLVRDVPFTLKSKPAGTPMNRNSWVGMAPGSAALSAQQQQQQQQPPPSQPHLHHHHQQQQQQQYARGRPGHFSSRGPTPPPPPKPEGFARSASESRDDGRSGNRLYAEDSETG